VFDREQFLQLCYVAAFKIKLIGDGSMMSFGLGLSSVAKLNTDGVQKLDFRPISREILETEKVVRQLLSAVVAKFE